MPIPLEKAVQLPIETIRAERVRYVWGEVKDLISHLGGNTHVELALEHGAELAIREGDLAEEAKDFLLGVIDGELAITLHSNGVGEIPYYEVLVGRPKSLRGLQCYGFSEQRVLVNPRQNFDPVTSAPINPESCRKLNTHLNRDEDENPFKVTTDLLGFVKGVIKKNQQGLSIITY